MKKAIAGGIVRYRVWILLLLLFITVWSVPQISRTRINYDLTRYLSDSTMTRRALNVMETEFGSAEQLQIMFADQSEETVAGFIDQLNAMEEIRFVQYDPTENTVKKTERTGAA